MNQLLVERNQLIEFIHKLFDGSSAYTKNKMHMTFEEVISF